jgi:hypothetical protein
VAPLRLGGLRGKQSTPSDWLGGTGEGSTVGKQERQGARDINRGVMPVLILYLKRCSRLRIVVFTINAIRQINMVITECQFSFSIKML